MIDDPLLVAMAAGVLSLVGVIFTAHVNRREHELRKTCLQLERGLRSCRRDRLYFRQHSEVLEGALLSLMPEGERLELLTRLGGQVPPSDDDEADYWTGIT